MLLARKGVLGYFHVRSCLHSSSQHVFSWRSAILWLVEPLWGFVNHKTYIWNCHGQFFCSFWRIHGNFSQEIFLWADRLHIKNCFPMGKSHLPKGKLASVTEAIVLLHFSCRFTSISWGWLLQRQFVQSCTSPIVVRTFNIQNRLVQLTKRGYKVRRKSLATRISVSTVCMVLFFYWHTQNTNKRQSLPTNIINSSASVEDCFYRRIELCWTW